MIADLAPAARVVLLDIEGTTTPISFVHDTLFPFARERLDAFLAAHGASAEVQRIVAALDRELAAENPSPGPLTIPDYLRWLMDRDRKSPGLKELQGLIWEDGYNAGLLRGVVWDDVPRAMGRWRDAGLRVAIYSSGSEIAQRRLFSSTAQGDLTRHIDAFFDTRMGGKLMTESYSRIAAALGVEPSNVCFVSDVTGELRAAGAAGMVSVLSVRPGNPQQSGANDFPKVTTFDDL